LGGSPKCVSFVQKRSILKAIVTDIISFGEQSRIIKINSKNRRKPNEKSNA
jgi:hypothetical protein